MPRHYFPPQPCLWLGTSQSPLGSRAFPPPHTSSCSPKSFLLLASWFNFREISSSAPVTLSHLITLLVISSISLPQVEYGDLFPGVNLRGACTSSKFQAGRPALAAEARQLLPAAHCSLPRPCQEENSVVVHIWSHAY